MFQSSLMSWSSQTIEVDTVESSQRISGIAPGLVVEPGVFLEVGDLIARRLGGSAPLADPLARLRSPLVDVDLIAEQQQDLGAPPHAPDQLPGEHPERVVLEALLVAVRRADEGLLVRQRDPAGAEADVQRPLAPRGPDRAGRQIRGLVRPAALAVERHLVGILAPGLQPLDADQREVVPLHREGRLAVAEHLDLAGRVGLDPDRRLGLADVAEQGTEQETGHAVIIPDWGPLQSPAPAFPELLAAASPPDMRLPALNRAGKELLAVERLEEAERVDRVAAAVPDAPPVLEVEVAAARRSGLADVTDLLAGADDLTGARRRPA